MSQIIKNRKTRRAISSLNKKASSSQPSSPARTLQNVADDLEKLCRDLGDIEFKRFALEHVAGQLKRQMVMLNQENDRLHAKLAEEKKSEAAPEAPTEEKPADALN